MSEKISTILATEVAPRIRPSSYPTIFAKRMDGRIKRPLGDVFGLKNFGVNLTTLAPGAQSALLHRHSQQDEFVYILEGCPTLRTEEGEFELSPGMIAGFPANNTAHMLVNRTSETVTYLEVGDRSAADDVSYPEDDLEARMTPQGWTFTHKDGTPY